MDDEWLIVGDSFELSEFIGGMVPIGVPFDAPLDFKKRLYAAAQSYVDGNKSVDYHLKRYGDLIDFKRPTEEQRELCNYLRAVLAEARSVYGELTSGIERESYLGLFASEICLARVFTSIRMASMMLLHGHLYEASAIMRVVLEQIAWAWAVHKRDDNGIFTVSSTKSIGALKQLISSAGKKYSLLSDYTHINPNLQRQYIDFTEEFAAVVHKQPERSAQMAVYLGYLVDDYRVVTERISFEYITKPIAWRKNENLGFMLVKDRPFLSTIEKFELKAFKNAQQEAPVL
jgi:hypothetical protein